MLNGDWQVSWAGEYEAGGVTFTYRPQDAARGESLLARGPLLEPVDLMVRDKLKLLNYIVLFYLKHKSLYVIINYIAHYSNVLFNCIRFVLFSIVVFIYAFLAEN